MNVSNRESIRHFTEKLKRFLVDQTTLFILVIIAVGVGSFCLGRISVIEQCQSTDRNQDRIMLCPQAHAINQLSVHGEQVIAPIGVVEGATVTADTGIFPYVASRNGTKYHHITCAGAKQIKETNKLFFATIQEAEAAGYSRAANCNK
jgi:adenylosuccinate synthase